MIGKTFGPESSPVVRNDLVERVYHIIKRVGFQRRAGAGSAVEKMAEIVNALRAFALLADDDIHPQPVERILIVKIDASPPGVPGLRSEIKFRRGIGGILQIAPGAAGGMVERSRRQRQVIPRLFGSEQAAARGQHRAE